MNILIIASGHTGSTLQVAELIKQNRTSDVVDIFDTSKKAKWDYTKYSVFIFGTNIHMGNINHRYKKYAKKLKKYYQNELAIGYLCGLDRDKNNIANFEESAGKIINGKAFYVGGLLLAENAKGFTKMIIKAIIQNEYIAKNIELPSLNMGKINALIEEIDNIN